MIQDVRGGHGSARTVDAYDHGFDLLVLRGLRQLFLERGQHIRMRNEALFILRADDPRQIEQQHFSIACAAELRFFHWPRRLNEIDCHATSLENDDYKKAELDEYGTHSIHTVSPSTE